jgi:hypothetical protein
VTGEMPAFRLTPDEQKVSQPAKRTIGARDDHGPAVCQDDMSREIWIRRDRGDQSDHLRRRHLPGVSDADADTPYDERRRRDKEEKGDQPPDDASGWGSH